MSQAAVTADVPAPPMVPVTQRGRHWLVGPWFDLVFIANVLWPLILLVPFGESFAGRAGVQFWQIYFVTTPHRWITLLLVFGDRTRFRERPAVFLGIAAAVIALCLTVRSTTGALTCLLTVDYIWNAWHFAAQHHGVFRIYTRLEDPQRVDGLGFEKWSLRIFLLYVTLRVAGATWGLPALESGLRVADFAILLLPILLVGQIVVRNEEMSRGGLGYLISLMTLYLGLLAAVHFRQPALVLMLATASALFHAIEYLTLVGWSARQRATRAGEPLGLLSWLVPRWTAALAFYVVVFGVVGYWLDRHWLEAWLTINVIVAFLHYSYDALIWRRARS